MSDSAIAKHLGVDHVTIGYWRNKLCPTGEIPQLTKRAGRARCGIGITNITQTTRRTNGSQRTLDAFTPSEQVAWQEERAAFASNDDPVCHARRFQGRS